MGALLNPSLMESLELPEGRRVSKGFLDAGWGSGEKSGNTLTARVQKVMSRGLSPKECYESVVCVNKCISSVARNLSKCHRRLFNRNGDEIVSGDPYNLLQRPGLSMGGNDFIAHIVSWWNIENEIACILYPGPGGLKSIKVLDPAKLRILDPSNWMSVHDIDKIKRWQYVWPDALEEVGPRWMMYHKGFNPFSQIRGLSPLITGNNEASGQYQVTRFNKTFFENNATPDHVVHLKGRHSKEARDAFEQKYRDQFGSYGDDAHKVLVVSGDADSDVEIKPTGIPAREGQFMELGMANKSDIAALFGVPPIIVGIHDQTRYETAEVQRQSFYEDTLCPQAETISFVIQDQIIDRFYRMDSSGDKVDPKGKGFSKHLQKAYGDALERDPEAQVIFLLDTDTMPIMSSIRNRAIEAAGNLSEKLKVSPKAAGDYFGLSFDEHEDVRSNIFVKTTEFPITDPALGQKMQPKQPENNPDKKRPSETKPAGSEQGQESRARKEYSDEERETAKGIEREIHGPVRKLFLHYASEGRTPPLAELDACFPDRRSLRLEFRRDCHAIRGFDPDQVKDYLNDKYDRAFCRELVA